MSSSQRKKLRMKLDIEEMGKAEITVNQTHIEKVNQTKYLGKMESCDTQDYIAAKANISNARRRWVSMKRLYIHKNPTHVL